MGLHHHFRPQSLIDRLSFQITLFKRSLPLVCAVKLLAELADELTLAPAGTTHRASRRRWRLPPSRATDTGSVDGAVRRPPQSDHVVESPARGWSCRCFRSRRQQRGDAHPRPAAHRLPARGAVPVCRTRPRAVRPMSRGAVCPDEPPTRQINLERAASRVASHRSRQTERRHGSERLTCKKAPRNPYPG